MNITGYGIQSSEEPIGELSVGESLNMDASFDSAGFKLFGSNMFGTWKTKYNGQFDVEGIVADDGNSVSFESIDGVGTEIEFNGETVVSFT